MDKNGGTIEGYWLWLPENHDDTEEWPVIFFLNGGLGSGPDPRASQNEGPSKYVANYLGAEKCIIINPHMKTGPKLQRQWYQFDDELMSILENVVDEFNGDKSRIYLTGLSRGGHGSWGLAKRYPDKFAALVPIAGSISCAKNCEELIDLPIWIVHNDGDNIVDVDRPRKAVEKMRKELKLKFETSASLKIDADHNLIYTEFQKEGHDAWSRVYSSSYFYDWLLTKRKEK